MEITKVTQKYQTTIPLAIRQYLHIEQGDKVVFELRDNYAILRRATPMDWQYTKGVERSLGEWESAEDEEAYRDL